MNNYSNIVLFGFMGTGKTRIGSELADKLGMQFVDMDDLVVERAGKSIPEIFADEGEAHFRRLERAIVKELSEQSGFVIATGGGVIKNADNVRDYGRKGLLICLAATPEVIMSRVKDDTNRPLLNTADKLTTIKKLLAERQPLYDTIPTTVDTSNLSADEVVDEIMKLFSAPVA